jgi:hypothetical protein
MAPLIPSPFMPHPFSLSLRIRSRWIAVGLLGLLFTRSGSAWEGGTEPTEAVEFAVPSGLWLGLDGGFSSSGSERQSAFGMLELGIAFDDLLAAPGVGLAMPGDAEAELDIQSPVQATDGNSPPSQRQAAGCVDAQSCGAHLAGPGLTPTLASATVAAALRFHGTARQLRHLESMAARSRAAASLPEVRLGAGTSRDESLRLAPTLDDPARFTRDGGRDLWFEARLTWRLDSALFSKDEIAIERLKAQQQEDRARITREVLDALSDWQRARLTLASEPLLPEERDTAELRELTALSRLDIASDGWFSRHLARRVGGAQETGAEACGSGAGALQGAHGFRDSAGAGGPQTARRCAKGASLTSPSSNAN